MLEIVSFTYISAQLMSLIMSWPQLHKLLVMKNADEMSLLTWSMWLFAQTITTVYAVFSMQMLWSAVSLVWMAFDIAMVVLIVRYRPKKSLQPVQEVAEQNFNY